MANRRANFKFFVIISLLLAACGAAPAQPPTPAISQLPGSTGLPATSTVLPPTSTFTASPTAVPVLPDPAGYAWNPVIAGWERPVDIQNASDGSGKLFIIERPGRIVILKGGQILPTPFLDISAKVGSRYTEQGLLGLAFHPDYARNGFFYVNYTEGNENTVIARFHVSASDPDLADPASEPDILSVDQPYNNHNGGGLAFGPDGYLYIGFGDGGS
jgi:glucose/arabinose dehydrogenase